MENKSSLGNKKLLFQAITILFGGACALFVAYLFSLTSYNLELEQKDHGWGEGKVFVGASVKDKITNGSLGNGYMCDVFCTYYDPQKPQRSKEDIGKVATRGNLMYTEENIEALKEIALNRYKESCRGMMIVCGVASIVLWFVRRKMKRKYTDK